MRVLFSTYGSRGGVEPVVGLAVRLRALGTQVRLCAPPAWGIRRDALGISSLSRMGDGGRVRRCDIL